MKASVFRTPPNTEMLDEADAVRKSHPDLHLADHAGTETMSPFSAESSRHADASATSDSISQRPSIGAESPSSSVPVAHELTTIPEMSPNPAVILA